MFFKSKKPVRHRQSDAQLSHGSTMSKNAVEEHIWVDSSQLELGMYVNELDRPWEQTRFMFQGFVIDSYKLLRQVQESCTRANIQTQKVGLVYSKSANRLMQDAGLQ